MKTLLLLLLLIPAGCTIRTIKVGESLYTSKRFGNAEKIGSLEFVQGTNRLRVEGWQSDQVTFAKEVTAAAVTSAVKAAK